jgi:archaeal flagellar protein FlaJ
MFRVPFSLFPPYVLKKRAHNFLWIGEGLEKIFPKMGNTLKQAEVEYTVKEYLSMCFFASLSFFVFSLVFVITGLIVLFLSEIKEALMLGLILSLIITFCVFILQIAYPRIYANRRIKDIEKNLIPALQNILVQLNAGVPLFDIMVNISKSDYGEISREFTKAIKEINGGKSQVEALDEMVALNPSLFFRRAIWQIVNGMKSGADLSNVIKEIIDSLSEEQILEIQKYGSQLNPLAMFYMIIVVILPSLAMTFMIVLSSFISMSDIIIKIMFWGLYGMLVFAQIMFLGLIRSRRPNLLG